MKDALANQNENAAKHTPLLVMEKPPSHQQCQEGILFCFKLLTTTGFLLPCPHPPPLQPKPATLWPGTPTCQSFGRLSCEPLTSPSPSPSPAQLSCVSTQPSISSMIHSETYITVHSTKGVVHSTKGVAASKTRVVETPYSFLSGAVAPPHNCGW